jgi:two-component SAPR family response regulator
MKILRILIVESEMSWAMDLEMMIQEIASATFVTEASVGAAMKVLPEDLDFAFLDVDVTKGKTLEIAEILEGKHVPYAFISASRQDQLPLELRSAPFIPKPFYAAQIKSVLQAIAA